MIESMMNFAHSNELFDPCHARPVIILGAGSVGGQVAFMLAKCGAREITVYDDDVVKSHNLPMTSVFGIDDIGLYKVDVLARVIEHQTGVIIRARREMYTGQRLVGSVVCCVDSMDTRQDIVWPRIKENSNVDLFVDTRTSAHYLSIFTVRPFVDKDRDIDSEYYEQFLYPSSEARRQTCGTHGIVYITAVAAALATRALTSFWSGDTPRRHESVLLGDDGTHLTVSEEESEDGEE